jgi:hypothetical protein
VKKINTGQLALNVYGTPRTNRLYLNGLAGAKIAQGDFVTIDADGVSDIYEFRDSTPPLGGTPGRIWVYNGANAAASRANLASAIFGAVDAATITRTAQDPTAGTNQVKVITVGGSPAPFCVSVVEWTTAGYVAGSGFELNPTVVLLTATANTSQPTDVWDQLDFYNGCRAAPTAITATAVMLTTPMVGSTATKKGQVDFRTPFFSLTDLTCFITQNRSRAQNELSGFMFDYVRLKCAGGASPKNQVGDIVDCIIFKSAI